MINPFVYALVDPREPGHVRYVGMTCTNKKRPFEHAKRARRNTKNTPLFTWIRSLESEPAVLHLEVLETGTPLKFLGFVEKCYIDALLAIGHNLLNVAEGGYGGSPGPHTKETKVKMKAGWTPEVRAKHSAARKAYKVTAETREKLRVIQINRKGNCPHSDATKVKLSVAARNRPKISEETRAKMAARHKARWARQKIQCL